MWSRDVIISTAGNRNSLKWVAHTMPWEKLVKKLSSVDRGEETHEQFMRMGKNQQDELKDIGGFVGGKIFGGRRLASNIESRDIITLDLDQIPSGKTDQVLAKVDALGYAACVYSTRKHCASGPRLRVLVCLSETIGTEKYEPIARKVAEHIGIALCDPTTFDINRLMYWPSCSSDSDYVYRVFDHAPLDPATVLSEYGADEAWKQVERWPVVPGTDAKIRGIGKKKGDPCEKKGFVGAWCRNHDIYDVLSEDGVLAGIYSPTDDINRWTYAEGSTYGGALVYGDGKFIYSYHSTDPCQGELMNSWDLCRVHLFGHLDASIVDISTERHVDRLPSHKAMVDFASKDNAVLDDIARNTIASVAEDFGTPVDDDADCGKDSASTDVTWMRELQRDENGKVKPLQQNFVTILRNDPKLQGIRYNNLLRCVQVTDDRLIPWSRTPGLNWTNVDDANCRNYIAQTYSISGKDKVSDAVLGVASERAFDPIVEYLDALPEWDGVRRLDTLLVDYMGADDNPYTRAVTRKAFTACVARQYEPGRKFDNVLTLVGPQGIGKSTFFAKFGMEWFADGLTLTDMRDKTGAEKLQGRWIVEMGELVGMKKAESESIKSFLSCRDDVYRGAYTANAVNHPRRCIIVATTNAEEGFLRDTTGNRRFWPVRISGEGMFDAIDGIDKATVGAVWAEAKYRYRNGEALYLENIDVDQIAQAEQRIAIEHDERSGFVRDYLDTLLPDGWDDMDINARRAWLNNDFGANKGTNVRNHVCNIEIWCECYGKDKASMTKTDSYEISRIMSGFADWAKGKKTYRVPGPYGVQRYFERQNVTLLTETRLGDPKYDLGIKQC